MPKNATSSKTLKATSTPLQVLDPIVSQFNDWLSNLTSKNLIQLAGIYMHYKSQGQSMIGIKPFAEEWLPRIAAGKVSAEAVAALLGKPLILNKVARLPIVEQSRLAKGEPVPVVIRYNNNKIVTKMIAIYDLTRQQVKQIFTEGSIRSEKDQISIVKATKANISPKTMSFSVCVSLADGEAFQRAARKAGKKPQDVLAGLAKDFSRATVGTKTEATVGEKSRQEAQTAKEEANPQAPDFVMSDAALEKLAWEIAQRIEQAERQSNGERPVQPVRAYWLELYGQCIKIVRENAKTPGKKR